MRRFSRQVVECVIILVLLEEKIKRPAWRSLFPHEQGGSRILHVIPAKRKNIFAGESRPTRARGLKLHHIRPSPVLGSVAPHAGAWIETGLAVLPNESTGVAPHAGAWIETALQRFEEHRALVAPHAGAWIETHTGRKEAHNNGVAPHAGAWIETQPSSFRFAFPWSRPTRARGLKPLSAVCLAIRLRRAPRGRVD